MQRDDDIKEIKLRLDKMKADKSKAAQYDAILAIANNNMNINITLNSDGEHEVLWYNRKTGSSFDSDLELLVEYINEIDT